MKQLFILLFVFIFFCNLEAQELVLEKLPDGINTNQYDEISPVISRDGSNIFFTRVAYPEFDKTLIIEGKDMANDTLGHYDFYLRDVYSRIAKHTVFFPERSPYNQDVWIAKGAGDSIFKISHPSYPLNNSLPNSICSITPVSNEYIIINQFPEEGGMEKGFSIIHQNQDGSWSQPQPIFIEDYYTKSSGVSLTMSQNGEILILSLTRNDTYGFTDLYVSFRTGENSFSKPKNLGLDVNSRYRDATPSLSADNTTIYFSSNRPGRGGNDIYFVKRLDDSWVNWSFPRRFKPPINSYADDSQPYFNSATGYLYFTSKRNGSSDIYRVRIEKPKPKNDFYINCKVINSMTKKPIDAKILVIEDITKNKTSYKTQAGFASVKIEKDIDVNLEAQKEGFISHPVKMNKDEIFNTIELLLDPIEINANITLDPIYFKRSESQILPKSFEAVDKLAKILQRNPNIYIKIEGHTDSNGDKNALINLSEERARAVKDFLTRNGIAPLRIKIKGYGGTRPVTDNSTEELRELNRRVEVKIIKVD